MSEFVVDLSKVSSDAVLQTNSNIFIGSITRDKGNTYRGVIISEGKRILLDKNGVCLSDNNIYITMDSFMNNIDKNIIENKHESIDDVDIDEMVKWMSKYMTYKLLKNKYKGSHRGYGLNWLFERLLVELSELYNAMIRYDNEDDYEKIILECADINNFSTFIADNVSRKY